MRRKGVAFVADLKRWRVLLSPVRFELIEAMRTLAPCAIADLADALQRPADALYRHVQLLEKAGYLMHAGFRKQGRNSEQLFDLTADDFQYRPLGDKPGGAASTALCDTAKTIFKSAARVLRDSAQASAFDFSEVRRNVALLYEIAWLDGAEKDRVIGLMREIKSITDGRQRRTGSHQFALCLLLTPVTRSPRRREVGRASEF